MTWRKLQSCGDLGTSERAAKREKWPRGELEGTVWSDKVKGCAHRGYGEHSPMLNESWLRLDSCLSFSPNTVQY